MFMVQSAYAVLSAQDWAWRSGRLSLVAAVAVGSLVWACVVVPAWRRRAGIAAAAGRAASWSGPVSGAVLGTVAGFLTQAPGAATVASPGLAHALFAGHVALSVGVVAAVAAGTAVLTAGLAAVPPAAGRAARTWSAAAATVAVATAWTTAFATSIWVLLTYLPSGSLSRVRTSMMGAGLPEWQGAPTLVLLGCALVALTRRRDEADPPKARNRRRVPAGLLLSGLAVTAGGGAGLIPQLRIGAADSDDALFVLMSQRSMICAFAGWVALAVLLAAGRRGPVLALPAAVAAGFVTAALAGVLLFGIAAAGGRGRNVDTLVAAVRWPMWQLLVAVILTLPVLAAVAGRLRHRTTGLGAGVAVAVFGVALTGGTVPGLAVGPHDWSDYVTSLDAAPPVLAVRPSAPANGPAGRGDPGRPLDNATVTAALGSVDQLLPTGNRRMPDEADTDEPLDIRPQACRAALTHTSAVERARPRTADTAHSIRQLWIRTPR